MKPCVVQPITACGLPWTHPRGAMQDGLACKTPQVFERYNIVSDSDVREAMQKVDRPGRKATDQSGAL